MASADQASSRGLFLVLIALREGPKHGYEIASHLEARSAGFFSLSYGALYPILHKLERDGLIVGSWSEGEGKRKKVYSLTEPGKKALTQETELHDAQAAAFALLLGRPA